MPRGERGTSPEGTGAAIPTSRNRDPRERAPGAVDTVLADSCFSGAPLISILLPRHYEHPDTFHIRCLHSGLEKHTQNRVLIS